MKILPRKQPLDNRSGGRVDSPALSQAVAVDVDPRYQHVTPPHADPPWMRDAVSDVHEGLMTIANQHQQFMSFSNGRLKVKRG